MTHEELRDAAYAIIRDLPTADEVLEHVQVVINPRLRASLGNARRTTAGVDRDPDEAWFVVELNPCIMQDPSILSEVVRHEAAHIVAGPGRGHDAAWREVATRFGVPPVTKCDRVTYVPRREHRHDVECPGCGARFTVTTRSARKIARDPAIWKHSRCGHIGLKILSESITKVQ